MCSDFIQVTFLCLISPIIKTGESSQIICFWSPIMRRDQAQYDLLIMVNKHKEYFKEECALKAKRAAGCQVSPSIIFPRNMIRCIITHNVFNKCTQGEHPDDYHETCGVRDIEYIIDLDFAMIQERQGEQAYDFLLCRTIRNCAQYKCVTEK